MNPAHNLKIVTFPRFLAGLAAVFWHFILTTNFIQKVEPFKSQGWAQAFTESAPVGMAYFYALSGFVLAAVYYKPGMRSLDTRHFFLMRLARIYPIFFLSLALYIAVAWPKSVEDPLAVGLNVLLLQAWISPYPLSLNYPAWTLSVELFFYALFPFLIVSFDRYRTRALFLGIGLIWLVSGLLQAYYTVQLRPGNGSVAHEVLIYLPPMNLSGFLCGMLGGICLVRHGRPLTPSKPVNISIAIFCALMPAALTLRFGREVNVGGTAPFMAVLMYVLVTQRTRLWDWMSLRFFENLGHISYAMCIFQVPLFILCLRVVMGRYRLTETELFYGYFALLMATSYLVYFFYESPLREKARRFLHHRRHTEPRA